ncbi:MAG: aspartate kinase [Proteobacteria bacterium]|nr:aspartate kinase [Pseudomonadota bacterium]
MSRLVMKFGGTSLADVERIRGVATLVAAEAAKGPVAVVVSAMAGRTNEMVAWVDSAGPPAPGLPSNDDEYDAVVSSGEQITAGLLALVLRNQGVRARSYMGWQAPILTDGAHGKARIESVDGERMAQTLESGVVAVIAGFQGVTAEGRISTLGRGGSDTSAVAVAAALGARCDIYTDVDGVFTTDPRIEARARKLERVSYEEMLELASLGAKVLQTRSVELAMAYRVPVRVLSSFALEPGQSEGRGTLVCDEEEIVEKRIVSGVAYSRDEAKISLLGLPSKAGTPAEIFRRLAEANVNVDMIVQSRARFGDSVNMEFTVGRRDAGRTLALMEAAQAEIGFEEARRDEEVAKVSVVGVGMKSHAGVAETMFRALADRGIAIQVISTSEIKISVLIDAAYTELAVRALHAAYGLDQVGEAAGAGAAG